jgi:hypothetical protein
MDSPAFTGSFANRMRVPRIDTDATSPHMTGIAVCRAERPLSGGIT